LTDPRSNFDLALLWTFCAHFLVAVILLKYLDQVKKADTWFLASQTGTRRSKPGTIAASQKVPAA
jgi:hypothetical protein